jgi:hypothetical protein
VGGCGRLPSASPRLCVSVAVPLVHLRASTFWRYRWLLHAGGCCQLRTCQLHLVSSDTHGSSTVCVCVTGGAMGGWLWWQNRRRVHRHYFCHTYFCHTSVCCVRFSCLRGKRRVAAARMCCMQAKQNCCQGTTGTLGLHVRHCCYTPRLRVLLGGHA